MEMKPRATEWTSPSADHLRIFQEMDVIEMERLRLCPIDAPQDGEPVAIPAGAFPALAVYNVDGQIYVTANTCTHGNAQLTAGYQDGATNECPYHCGARSETRRVGERVSVRVDLGGRRIIQQKKKE